jgi:hypothetical protein
LKDAMINIRTKKEEEWKQWKNTIKQPSKTISLKLTKEQNGVFQQIKEELTILKRMYLCSQLAMAKKTGACSEQAWTALLRLLKEKIKYGLNLKFQKVNIELGAPEPGSNINIVSGKDGVSKPVIWDHQYLLLDSNIADVTIRDNRKAVAEHLAKITQGKICDPWNSYFADFVDHVGGLYDARAEWSCLSVQTISMDFLASMKTLPQAAQNFFYSEFSKIELDITPKAATSFFANANTDNRAATVKAETVASNDGVDTRPRVRLEL